jgi:transaldolase
MLEQLKVKLYADLADKAAMLELYRSPLIRGFTTNPTLMRKSGSSRERSWTLSRRSRSRSRSYRTSSRRCGGRH